MEGSAFLVLVREYFGVSGHDQVFCTEAVVLCQQGKS